MPLTRIDFNVAGALPYARAFETFGSEADDLSEPFHDVADIIRLSVGEQFGTEGSHSGLKWQPLSPGYAAWKEANYGALPILVRTGDMRSAALSRSAFQITAKRLLYEVDDDKAIHHQRGDGHMPKRELVSITGPERRSIDRAFASWLNGLRHSIIGAAR